MEGGDDIHAKELTAIQSSKNDFPKGSNFHLYLYDAQLKKRRKCLHFSLNKLLNWNFVMAACHPLYLDLPDSLSNQSLDLYKTNFRVFSST